MYKKIFACFLAMIMILSAGVPVMAAEVDTAKVSIYSDADSARGALWDLLSEAASILRSPEFGTNSSEVCDRFEQAYGMANRVYYNPDSTLEELNAQIDSLSRVIDEVKDSGVSENAAYYLSSSITSAQMQVGGELDYTAESYSVYAHALSEAKRVQTEGKNDAEVIAAADALNAAVKDLVPLSPAVVSARAELRNKLNRAYGVLSGDVKYTEESIRNLETAIADAEKVYYDPAATAAQLYYEVDNITNTINNMEEIEISDEVRNYLAGVIEMADAQVGSEEDYTPESWSVYFDAYQEAVRVQNVGVSEEEFNSAANALGEAVTSLVPADTGANAAREVLITMINSAHKLLSGDKKYTAESVARLQDALDSANNLYVNENATEQELLDEATALQNAINLMKEVAVSEDVRAYLEGVISLADSQVGEEKDYTPESWSVYHKAYLEAVRVLSEGESDEEFTSAANALGEAVEGLVLADSELQEARAELLRLIEYSVTADLYTAQSVERLESARQNATAVYNDENATKEDIEGQIKSMQDAIDGLEPVTVLEQAVKTLENMIVRADSEVGEREAYTPESWQVYADAYANAVETMQNGKSDSDYYLAAQHLLSAMEGLEPAVTTPDEVYVLLGDADCNGKVNIKDATFIQKCVAGITELTGDSVFAADANGDGKINVRDATEIQKYLAGLNANENIGRDIPVVSE